MNKLIIIPILFVLAFSQSGNQETYTIHTRAKSYKNVMLYSVEGNDLIVNEQNSPKKYTIPISYINGIRIKEIKFKPNTLGKPVGCVFGLSLGGIGGGLIGFGLYSQSSGSGYTGSDAYAGGYNGLIVPVAMLGGMVIGAWQGYKLGPSIGNMLGDSSYVSQTQLVSFEDKSLNEKIYYLKSLTNQ